MNLIGSTDRIAFTGESDRIAFTGESDPISIRLTNIAGITLFTLCLAGILSCARQEEQPHAYPIQPVPFTSVQLTDSFWAPRIHTNHLVTIPIAIDQSTVTGRIRNFEIAGGMAEGEFSSMYPFDDSDVYKIIEAAGYSLQTFPDAVLEQRIDSLINKIVLAQEQDGYLYTYMTIMGPGTHPWVGERWEKTNELSHELYNVGHMYEAAVAYYRATGKRALLDAAIKNAGLVDRDFGWNKIEDYPGHQEIELGLIKLSRLTGEERYLDLARFFLDVRGPGGRPYNQAHKKVTEQTRAVGHAVRATYMYAAMADIAALYQDEAYIRAVRSIWKDMVHTKTYVTGGIGASGGNEGFDQPYHLPNRTAYCETCASVGFMLWNYRMFLHEGDARYMNVFEKTLYNSFLSGVSLSGDRFFYPNVLESHGEHQRKAWFGCACCPPNVARTLPSLPGYIYAHTPQDIYVNLFMDHSASISLNGKEVQLEQQSSHPWEGTVDIRVNPERTTRFTLRVRIPGWAGEEALPGQLYRYASTLNQEPEFEVNGEVLAPETEKGYALIRRRWKSGDRVRVKFPMEIRQVLADGRVKADSGRVSIQRGPLVYAAEWPDSDSLRVLQQQIDTAQAMSSFFDPDLLGGIQVIEPHEGLTLIPYYAWNNRGPGEMLVWMPISN